MRLPHRSAFTKYLPWLTKTSYALSKWNAKPLAFTLNMRMHAFYALQYIFKELTLVLEIKANSSKMKLNVEYECIKC